MMDVVTDPLCVVDDAGRQTMLAPQEVQKMLEYRLRFIGCCNEMHDWCVRTRQRHGHGSPAMVRPGWGRPPQSI